MTLHDLLVPTYAQMLRTLATWLTKAAAQRPDGGAEALLSARLAPDMFPLATQIRFACRQAQEGVFRLRQEDFPASLQILLDEGRDAGERPGTMSDAHARIAETLIVVEAPLAGARALDPTATVAHALPNGMTLDLTAGQYARDWALPQFYFHVVAAYSILRAQGGATREGGLCRAHVRLFPGACHALTEPRRALAGAATGSRIRATPLLARAD